MAAAALPALVVLDKAANLRYPMGAPPTDAEIALLLSTVPVPDNFARVNVLGPGEDSIPSMKL